MEKVSFFIVGNWKSGTTTFYNLLRQHPEIYLPSYKESKYFCIDLHRESDEFHGKKVHYPIRDICDYEKLYQDAYKNQILGETTPHYTYSSEAAQNIYSYNPDAKILVFLREPIAFLRSLHFDHLHSVNETEQDFLKALSLEESRRKGDNLPEKLATPSYLYYSDWVKYKEQIKRYVDLFGEDNVKIVFLENIKKDQESVYKDILKFIGVEDIDYKPNFNINRNSSRTLRKGGLYEKFKYSFLWDLFVKILPVKLYSFFEPISNMIFLKKAKKKSLNDKEISNLRREYLSDVKELNRYLNEKDLIDFDLVEFWGYEDINV